VLESQIVKKTIAHIFYFLITCLCYFAVLPECSIEPPTARRQRGGLSAREPLYDRDAEQPAAAGRAADGRADTFAGANAAPGGARLPTDAPRGARAGARRVAALAGRRHGQEQPAALLAERPDRVRPGDAATGPGRAQTRARRPFHSATRYTKIRHFVVEQLNFVYQV